VTVSKPSPEKPELDQDEWDAEVEAEFQRVTGQTKAGTRARRRSRHIGCPVAFMADVCRLTCGRTALVVAQCIYRRTMVCKTKTVTLPVDELADLGITRRRKNEALIQLQKAGLIEVVTAAAGRSHQIILTWEGD
jgi:hypothetical protein